MGGGVFSPSLVLGALTGLAFGLIATGVFPDISGSQSLYALAGMGAVSAAVLGAPISTTLIVFELTGDWQTGLAVMVAVSLSTALASRLVDRSFFLTQIERRGVHLAAGPQSWLLATLAVSKVMRRSGEPGVPEEAEAWALHEKGLWLTPQATLELAMPVFERSGAPWLPIVAPGGEAGEDRLLGVVFEIDALRAYNRALCATAAEEHS
jgi:CIC family chloride channel protein